MPFQSEKQRRYLWANEPEIARDWTDTYGSGIAKALGGRIGYNRGRVVNPGGYAGELSGSELFLKLYKEGKIDNLQQAMEDADRYDAGETTNYEKKTGNNPLDMYQKYSDPSEVSLGSGLAEETKQIINEQKNKLQQGIQDSGVLKDLGLDQSKGTIDFDPNNVQINKAGMIPDNFIEQIKSLWGGEPEVPTGIMKAGGYPQETMANWSELDDLEAQQADAQRQMQLARLANMEQYPPTEEGESGNWLANLKKYTMPAYNFMRGNVGAGVMGLWNPLAALTTMFAGRNRGPVINPATQRFIQDYNVGRNRQTGRMTSGPFAGRNLPGTSMFGSKTPQQMAQNWMSKYGSMEYNTERQIAKQKEIRDIAAGNLNLPPSERIPTPKKRRAPVGPPPGGGPHGNGGGGGGYSHPGSAESRASSDPFARGGLAALWQR